MSRVGNKPVPVPEKVKVAVKGSTIEFEGPKGKLAWTFHREMQVAFDEGPRLLTVKRPSDQRRHRALHGLTRAIIANMVIGVTQGYEGKLELYGTGFSLALQGKKLLLNCGFAKPVEKMVPAGLEVVIDTPSTRGRRNRTREKVSGTRANRSGVKPARRSSRARQGRKGNGERGEKASRRSAASPPGS